VSEAKQLFLSFQSPSIEVSLYLTEFLDHTLKASRCNKRHDGCNGVGYRVDHGSQVPYLKTAQQYTY
jgi:hypothetical protein